jgi:hypothetical protein
MFAWIRNLLGHDEDDLRPEPMDMLRKTGSFRPNQPAVKAPPGSALKASEPVSISHDLGGDIEERGPNKNVLVRKRFVREDTGTHETLKIVDESLFDSGEETGIDPYNTGQFDRSRNWDRSRK